MKESIVVSSIKVLTPVGFIGCSIWSHNLCFKQCGYLLTQVFRVVLKIDSVVEMQFVRICGIYIDADALIVGFRQCFVFCLQYSGVRDNDVHTSVGNKELV